MSEVQPFRRIRVRGGPEAWSFRVEDIESGQVLPAKDIVLRFDRIYDYAVVELTLCVDEVDIELDAEKVVGVVVSDGTRRSIYYGGGQEKLIESDA